VGLRLAASLFGVVVIHIGVGAREKARSARRGRASRVSRPGEVSSECVSRDARPVVCV